MEGGRPIDEGADPWPDGAAAGVPPAPGYRGTGRRPPTERAERTAQRMVRFLAVALALSLAGNVMLAAVLKSLFPLVRVQPALVQFSDKRFYRIEPMYQSTTAETKAREAFARRYVAERETINLVNDAERWQWIKKNSTGRVWSPFYARLFTERTWERMESQDATRSVRVLASWSLEDDPTRWAVEYRRFKYRLGEPIEQQDFVATIILDETPGRATDAELFDNPFRLRVVRYSVSPKSEIQAEGQ